MSILFSPVERLELARTIVAILEEHGLVAKIDPLAVSQGTTATLLGCCKKTVSALRRRGELDTVMIGSTPHVSMASIRAFAARKEVADAE